MSTCAWPTKPQDGSLGEPLRDMPWDFTARASGDAQDYERGGRVMTSIPTGYYIDLTHLAVDYGWARMPALRTWQQNFGAIQYWELVKTDNLSWNAAMLELYTEGELNAFLSGDPVIPSPPPLPTESPTPDAVRTAHADPARPALAASGPIASTWKNLWNAADTPKDC